MSHRRGLTLVELLVAMLVTTFLAIAIGTLYRKTQARLTSQSARIQTRTAPADALQSLRADLMRAFDPGQPDTRMTLTQEVGVLEFSFAITERMSPDAGRSTVIARRVGWSLSGRAGEAVLKRSEKPLAGPGSMDPPVSRDVLDRLVRFNVELQDGTNGLTQWPPADTNMLPRLVRLQMERTARPSNEVWSLDVWIPAGHTFQPKSAAPGR